MNRSLLKKILFCAFVVLLACTLLFTACKRKKTIPVPQNLTIVNDVLSWDPVTGSLSYDVKVDDAEVYSVNEPSFALPFDDYDSHSFAVRAITYNGTGKYSKTYTYARSKSGSQSSLHKLYAPYDVTMTSNRLMWGAVLNNNGYRIYLDTNAPIVVPKNTYYYDFDFPKEGTHTYYIRIQTVGDGVTYSDSNISNAFSVTVTNGKAPLLKLPSIEFTFDVQNKQLVWTNPYSADAVTYLIFQEGISDAVDTIPADGTKIQLSYKPNLTGARVSYKMQLVSNDGLYLPSDFNQKITFPLADDAPADFALLPSETLAAYAFSWSGVRYNTGYAVEIDGARYDAGTSLLCAVPNTLGAGRHVARVLATGDGVWYGDSVLSEGIVFYTADKGKITTRLQTPVAPSVGYAEEALTLSVSEVERANRYRFEFRGKSGTQSLTVESASFTLKGNMIGERMATEEERAVMQKIFADLATGVCVSVCALPSDPLYAASLRSEERFISSDTNLASVGAPQNLSYGSVGFKWSTPENDERQYEILLDGAVHQTSDSLNVESGEHFARVRVKETNALWSEEIVFRLPMDLKTPTDLSLSGNALTFKGDANAIAYRLSVTTLLQGKPSGEAKTQTVYPVNERISLDTYVDTDGEYVLELVTLAKDSFYADSAPSRQVSYVKSDAASGTQAKPFTPRTAAELWNTLHDNPTSYFELVANVDYDFSKYNFSLSDPVVFSGTLLGNGATLTGIKTGSPLFSALTNATISNLTVQMEGDRFDCAGNGFLAKTITSSTLTNVVLSVKDGATLTEEAPFGLLCYEATEVRAVNVTVDCDLTYAADSGVVFGGFAYSATGSISGSKLKGKITFSSGLDLTFGGVSVNGETTLTGWAPTLAFSANVTGNVVFGGCSVEGVVKGNSLDQRYALSANGAKVDYYGVAKKKVTLSGGTIAGTVQARASQVSLYGVGESEMLSLNGVTVSTSLDGTAINKLRVAGVADTLDASTATTGLTFAGRVNGSSPDLEAAGIAFSLKGTHTLTSAGDFTLTGTGTTKVAACALSAETLTLHNSSVITLNKVTLAEVGGAVLGERESDSEKTTVLTLSGSVQLNVTECDSLFFGGAILLGKQDITIQDYEVVGSVTAGTLRFGGVSCDGEKVSLSVNGLSVKNTKLISENLMAAGAVLSASELLLSAGGSLSSTIEGVGSGEIAGFGLQVGTRPLSDLTISGGISLKGSGTLYGVSDDAGETESINCSVSLKAEGEVDSYALFRSLKSANGLTYHDAQATILSDRGSWCAVGSVRMNALSNVTLSEVTLKADPIAKAGSSMRLYGVTDAVGTLQRVTISGVSYEIGEYEDLSFAGVANKLTTEGSDLSILYALRAKATSSAIGGAFLSASGALYRVTLGDAGKEAPLSINATGAVRLGGLILSPGPLTLSGGGSLLAFDLSLLGENSEAGGLFASLTDNRQVTISEHKTTLTLTRSSGGALSFGGAAAMVSGILTGARIDLDLTGLTASDRVGGVASQMSNGTLVNCSAYGSVRSAGAVGGLACNAAYSRLQGGATALEITTPSVAGGLFATVSDTTVENAYSVSRMKNKGAGLFGEAVRVSLDDCYFAGTVTEYSLAGSVSDCSCSSLYLDAALVGAEGIVPVGSGSLPYEVRSFGYGYRSGELDDEFTTDGLRYPYLTQIGRLPEETVKATQALRDDGGALLRINVAGELDLYTLLPRFRDGVAPTVTWVDDSGKLSIQNGVATVVENESGTLYGYVSGSSRPAYSVLYSASGFVPFAGKGTKEDPYVISDLRYIGHVSEFSRNYYTAYLSTPYFLLDLEEEEVSGAEFSTLFTSDEPFRGHFSFGGVRLRSPLCGENGIFGYLDGATLSDLVLCGELQGVILARYANDCTLENVELQSASLAEEFVLVEEAVDSTLLKVTAVAKVRANSALDFALVGSADHCVIQEVSLSLTVNTHDDVSACLAGVATSCAVTQAQVLWVVKQCGKVDLSLVKEDHGSAYSSCMTLTEVSYADPDESVISGLSHLADGTTYDDCAVVLRANGISVSPLVGEGTATYDDLSLLFDGETAGASGVTVLTVQGAKAALAAKDGYLDGVIATPLGYDLFDETVEPEFELDQNEVVISSKTTLSALTTLLGEKPFATFVGYSFAGSCAVIEGDALRPKWDGDGTLTLTDLYGVEREIAVTVQGYTGFAEGAGTEDDPYLIETFDDFLKMLAATDGDAYYALTGNIEGEMTESALFRGILTSQNYSSTLIAFTVTVDLACDALFSEAYGIVEGVDFVIRKDSFSAEKEASEEEEEEETVCGLFAEMADGLTVKNATIRVECPSVTLSGVTFGFVVGALQSGSRFERVTILVSSATITAQDALVGVAFGRVQDGILNDVEIKGALVTDKMTLVGEGEVTFGAIGTLRAAEMTRTVYDPLTETESTAYYAQAITTDLTVTASGETLILGGLAGRLDLAVYDADVTLVLTLGGGDVTAGGVAGVNDGSVLSSVVSSNLSSSATLASATIGGIAGSGSGSISDSEAIVTVDVTAEGRLLVGGALGSGDGDLADLALDVDLSARSTASESALASLYDPAKAVVLVSVGGVAGSHSGEAARTAVSVTKVRATSDYVGEKSYLVYAGGVAGAGYIVQDAEIKGTGSIVASGGVSVAAGIAAYIDFYCDSCVVDGVTLSADSIAGGVGLLSTDDEEGEATNLFIHLKGLSADTPALVYKAGAESKVEGGRYLSGKAVGDVPSEGVKDLSSASASQFLTTALYEALDGDIWNVTAGAIPSLK